MKYCLPDYDNCLVNLSNSILKNFGAETSAPTLKLADDLLDGGYKNVVLLLLDAMGCSIMEKHLKPDGFFRSHLAGNISSVFPPTTVAATTSVISGLYPNEHGWLGWDTYFPNLVKNVAVFLNSEQMIEDPNDRSVRPRVIANVPAADYHVAFRYCPYKSIMDRITEAGEKGYWSSPYVDPAPKDLGAVLKRTEELCSEPGRKYIYAYWVEPDQTMHMQGTDGKVVHDLVNSIESQVEEFASRLTDTLLLITADHGHMNSINHCILDYPEIMKCLVRLPSIEPRTLNFFVKDGYKEEFPKIFEDTFKDKFLLLTHDEVMEKKLFGLGKDHEMFNDMIGDYVAIATGNESILNTHLEASKIIGAHAGLTREEMEIPLIAAGL